MRRVWNALLNVFGKATVDRDLDAEVASFETLLADEKSAAGQSAESARRAARLEVGGADHVKESVRDVRAGAAFERIARDVRYAFRTLGRSPAFTTFTLLTFALAVGGITIIFSLVNAVLLKPLPYPDADRLVMVLEADLNSSPTGGSSVAAPNYLDWERQNQVFEQMALFEPLGFNISGEGAPEQVGGIRVTHGIFEALHTAPMLGRGFTTADDAGGNGKVVVLAYRLWKRRYNADSSIVGRSIRLNKEPWLVVGVMPEGFAFPGRNQQVFVPIALNAEDQGRASHSFWAFARLKDGVSVAQARTAMRTVGDRLRAEYPQANADETVNVFPMRDLWVSDIAETLRALMVAVALVLVIASANVAGLMVARGSARRREIAARLALGGTRARVMHELVTESVVLAIGGAALGLGLAVIGIRALIEILPQSLKGVPFRDFTTIPVDGVVFGFAVLVALTAGLAAGLPSAFSVVPTELADVLRDGAAHGATSRRGQRLRGMLVGLEVALAVVVLVGAGLLVSSARRLHSVAPGLNPDNVLLLNVSLPQPDFYGPAVRTSFCTDIQREGSTVPGVSAISAVSHVPLSGGSAGRSFIIEGMADPGPENLPGAQYGVACPGYFGAMGIPLKSGREFAATDARAAPAVVIVNETLARRFFPGQDAVGKRFKLGHFGSPNDWLTIVGVAGDVHHSGLQAEVRPYMYAPYQQAAWPNMTVVVRTARAGLDVAAPMRQALARVTPEEPIGDAQTMHEVVESSLGHLRFPMVLFGMFGAVALLLAALGVFGVATQSVLQRRRELGIRMALGAKNGQLYRLVMRQSMVPAAWGIVAGIAGALLATRVLSGLLYDIKPTDPLTIGLGAMVLAAVTLVACLIPARHATRVDPAIVLRQD